MKTKEFRNLFSESGSFAALMLYTVCAPGLGIIVLTATSNNWLPALKEAQFWAIPVFLLATMILASLSLIPSHAASLISGILFGSVLGPMLAILGVVLASGAGFLVMRRCLGDRLVELIERRPKAMVVYRALLQREGLALISLITLLRLSPVMPFAMTNLIFASARVPFAEFLWGSAVGLAPRVILVALAGAGLSELDLSQGSDQTLAALGIGATLLSVVIIGRMAKRALAEAVLSS